MNAGSFLQIPTIFYAAEREQFGKLSVCISLEILARNCNLLVFRDALKSANPDLRMYIGLHRYTIRLGRETYRSG